MINKVGNTNHARANVLGVGVSAIDLDFALDCIDTWIANDHREYVVVSTVHTVMECQKSALLRAAVNDAGMVTPDGMPLVWLARWESDHPVKRVYGPDLMLAVCEHSLQRGYRHYFYGGAAGVPELLADELTSRYPGLQIAGTYSPPFRRLTLEEKTELEGWWARLMSRLGWR